ncbi:hypothetical protein I204_08275 [Kwoniella mangroviensis CBS 8886]|uniref:hypothetical protein n=1 Tax=Kwoniella mangroviensis CBS 8507 TaxID=1296122 RepID=UPI00080CDCD7|nr:hypothetical protein I204_08275 [Kwoniella mangroviensis CBS 8886]
MSDSNVKSEGRHGITASDLNARLDALLNDTNDPGTAREATLLGATDSLLTKIDRSLYRNDEKFKRVKIILDDFKSDNDTKKSTAYKYDLIEVQQSLKHTLTGPEEDLLTYIAHKHRPSDELILVWATFEDRFLNTRSGSSESIYTNPWKTERGHATITTPFFTSRFQTSAFWCLTNTYSNFEEDSVFRSSNSTLLNEVDVLMSNLCEGNVQAAISDYDNGQLSSLLMQTREWDCGNANTNKIYNDQMVNLWGTLKELQSCVIGQTASQDQPIEEAHAIEI